MRQRHSNMQWTGCSVENDGTLAVPCRCFHRRHTAHTLTLLAIGCRVNAGQELSGIISHADIKHPQIREESVLCSKERASLNPKCGIVKPSPPAGGSLSKTEYTATNTCLSQYEDGRLLTSDFLPWTIFFGPSPLDNVPRLDMRTPNHFSDFLHVDFWYITYPLKSGHSRISP